MKSDCGKLADKFTMLSEKALQQVAHHSHSQTIHNGWSGNETGSTLNFAPNLSEGHAGSVVFRFWACMEIVAWDFNHTITLSTSFNTSLSGDVSANYLLTFYFQEGCFSL